MGVTPLALAWIAWKHRKQADAVVTAADSRLLSARDVLALYAIVIGVGYVFTLGPGYPVGDIFVPLPYIVFARLPGFSSVRVASRYIFLAITGTAVLSAYALTYFAKHNNPTQFRRFLVIIALFMAFEFFPKPGETGKPRYLTALPSPIDTSAYAWVGQQPHGTLILEIPFENENTFYYLQQQRLHKQPTLNGRGSYLPDWRSQFIDTVSFPSPVTLEFIHARGVRYILIHRELLTATEQKALDSRLAQLQSNAQVRFIQIFGQVDVYELTSR
jgi:hypothetical protein